MLLLTSTALQTLHGHTPSAAQVLCNLLGKPPGVLFSELEGERSEFAVGDVQYHLGQQGTLSFPLPVRRCARCSSDAMTGPC